jgi:hypothetical protein
MRVEAVAPCVRSNGVTYYTIVNTERKRTLPLIIRS